MAPSYKVSSFETLSLELLDTEAPSFVEGAASEAPSRAVAADCGQMVGIMRWSHYDLLAHTYV